jgi:2-keto-4-pentenoate hydratase/2-oxohepta-3-ene-1,7-dioic acid hydratase in catechol pathway
MKIARYSMDGKAAYGAVEGEALVPLEGSIFKQPVKTSQQIELHRVKLLTPTRPSKVVCVGQNYLEHIKELGAPVPEKPVVFLKPPSCLIGPDENIIYPEQATRVDYEGELALVIGKILKNATPDEALEGVLGCSCFNDVTERDWAGSDPLLLTLSKGFDTFGCYGPWIDTRADSASLGVKTFLNGQMVQDDSTANCVFSVADILCYISAHMTLVPGDVVITGTPQGIGPMQPGDLVEVEVEGVGRISNKVAKA